MCDIALLRAKIEATLKSVVEARQSKGSPDAAACRALALELLTNEYDDKCPDECIRERVDAFFTTHDASASPEKP